MRRSIRFKLIVIFSSIVLLSNLAIAYLSYQSSVQLVKVSLSDVAGKIARHVTQSIDLEQYNEILTDSGETEYYEQLRRLMNDIRVSSGLTYLYTMAREQTDSGYKYYYVVDGMPEGDEDASEFGEEEDANLYPGMIELFETGEEQMELTNDDTYGAIFTSYYPLKSGSGEVIGMIGADFDATHIYESMGLFGQRMIITTVAILLVSIAIVYLFAYYLVNPLKRLIRNVAKINEGELTIVLDTRRTDEIGTLTVAFQRMADQLKQMIAGIQNNTSQLIYASNHLVAGILEVKEGNRQIAATMNELADGAGSQADAANEVSQTMNRFTARIQEASSSGAELSRTSDRVMALTNEGYRMMSESEEQSNEIYMHVQQSIAKLQQLNTNAHEIAELVRLIRDIADQTHLLSLNAAIEAARAGESGQGFAVVASEIRKLAEQVAGSVDHIVEIADGVEREAAETTASLERSFEEVEAGAKKIKAARSAFHDINASVLDMQNRIQSIAGNLDAIYQQSDEINRSMEHVVSIAVQSSAGIQQTSASAEQAFSVMDNIVESSASVAKLAENLDRSIEHFKI